MMKKLLSVAVVSVLGLLFSQPLLAQDDVKNRVGLFLAAASGDLDEIGLGGLGEFRVANRVSISPQLIFYFPEDRGNINYGFLEVNVNCNYYFYNKDIFEFYGLGGLNFTRWSVDHDNNSLDDSDVEIGLNFGGGINFEVSNKVIPFSEIRLTVGDFDQFVITGGLKFNLR